MIMNDVYKAYSSQNAHAFSEALSELRQQLISKVQTHGPAAVAFELSREQPLHQILNKVEAEASTMPSVFVAFLAGFIRAYVDYLTLIVNRQVVDSADAQLSAERDGNAQVDSVRMMILKAAFTHAGARAKELVSVVARLSKVSESVVKFHLQRLVEINLVDRIELGPKAVSYRISPLGEAVLARRSKPHEFALLFIDEAAFNVELRNTLRKEMEIAWQGEQSKESPAEEFKIFSDPPVKTVLSGPWSEINDRVIKHRKTVKKVA